MIPHAAIRSAQNWAKIAANNLQSGHKAIEPHLPGVFTDAFQATIAKVVELVQQLEQHAERASA